MYSFKPNALTSCNGFCNLLTRRFFTTSSIFLSAFSLTLKILMFLRLVYAFNFMFLRFSASMSGSMESMSSLFI